jgi:ubiquitin thioesterase OTU1
MEGIKVRIRWSSGNTLITVPNTATLSQLKKEIHLKTGITPPYQELKMGYPPKTINFPGASVLSSINIQPNENIMVEKRPNPVVDDSDTDTMILFRRIIQADNSCLFNSIAYALETKNKKAGDFLRNVVSALIESDPEIYNESMLGKLNQEYCSWILLKTSWGGGIELAILSKYYSVEIAAVSIQSAHIDLFGQEEGFDRRIYVIYDGIHYDVLVKNYSEEEPEETDVSVFSVHDHNTFYSAIKFAEELNSKKQFTDVTHFSLMCAVCFKGLVGETEAVSHAKETGHSNFQEYHK